VRLYSFFYSSASFRVRIALNLKGLDYEYVPVNLRAKAQLEADYRALNPQGLAPTLVDGETVLGQSLAICEYLEERHPEPPLLPADPVGRARVRALAFAVACEIHPLNNVRVLDYLTGPMGLSEERKLEWYRHWIANGLGALETLLAGDPRSGRHCHGDAPTLADVCLVPQVFNAMRYQCPLDHYPTVVAIKDACMALDAFDRAQPLAQPDAPR